MMLDAHRIANKLKSDQHDKLLQVAHGYLKIDRDLLELCSQACYQIEQGHPYNEYNRQRYRHLFKDGESIIRTPDLPRIPKPFRSWTEFRESVFGGMQDAVYEPKDCRMPVVIETSWLPDFVDPANDRICYDVKGVISDLHAAKKFIRAAEQNNIHIVFIFSHRDIKCVWSSPRVDGSTMTQEYWASKQGFSYCYEGEVAQFRNSERYKTLVAEFGKGYGTLRAQLARTGVKVQLPTFAHKQQSAHVTMTVQ